MNKNRKMKRKIAASVAVGMSVMMGDTSFRSKWNFEQRGI